MLTYSLVYTPDNSDEDKVIRYTCKDNKIHIRFRDYNKPQVIYGFEDKLTYLLTYLMNFYYLPRVDVNLKDEKELIKRFLLLDSTNYLLTAIESYHSYNDIKFKGLKLFKNYNKQNKTKYFGNVDINCFPIKTKIAKDLPIEDFLRNLGEIPLIDYLFNDQYKVIIHERKPVKIGKFERKQIRLDNKNKESDLVDLW